MYVRILLFLLGICFSNLEAVPKGSNITASAVAEQLYEDYFHWRLKDMPEFATHIGIHDYDAFLNDYSSEAYDARLKKCQEFLERVKALESEVTDESDVYTLKILKHALELYIKNFPLKGYYLQMSSFEGSAGSMNNLFEDMLQKTYDDYDLMIQRMQNMPKQFEEVIELMRAGVENNITFHWRAMAKINSTLGEFIVEDPEMSPLYKFFKDDIPESLTPTEVTSLQQRAKEVISSVVVPAYENLLNYTLYEYIPREQIAITSINNGGEFYKALIDFHTGTTYTPQEIHNIGLEEVARIEGNMKEVIMELGYGNMSIKEFSNLLREDPNSYYNTTEELMARINEIVHELIPPLIPSLFNQIPKTKIVVKKTPSDGGSFAYHVDGSIDGERPGAYYINSHNPKYNSKYGLLTLSLHESIPGHHLQGSYSNENQNFPLFRRYGADHSNYGVFPSMFPVYAYFVEGWGLYAEKLGFDMNLYGDPLDRYGHYTAEIFRASRLVVDTGIHALGWTRDEAIEYMLNIIDFSREKIANEVDRYITWPGQALAYKIGQLRISSLRAKAEAKLGEKFNIKDFHTVILDAYGPMEFVEAEVDKWIAETVGILSPKSEAEATSVKNTAPTLAQELFDDYFQWRMKDMPEFATKVGIHDYDAFLNDYSSEAYDARLKKVQEFLERVKSLESEVTDESDAFNLKILKNGLETYVKNFPLKSFYLQMSSFDGSAVNMEYRLEDMLQKSYQDYDLMVQRMLKIPKQFDQVIDLMRAGVESNITFHSVSLGKINSTLGKFIVQDPEMSPLYKFFKDDIPESLTQTQVETLQQRAKEVISSMVVPAYKKLLHYMLYEYVPREEIAITSINNGEAFYEACIYFHSGSDHSPHEIHKVGLKEVARIEKNMKEVIQELGYGNMSIKEFSKLQREDPNSYYNTTAEIMARIDEIVHELVPPRLPALFNEIPKTNLIVKKTPTKAGGFAYYKSGSIDGERPGAYYINSHNPKYNPKSGLLTLSLHEGSPGHHFQGSYTNENENFPLFRRYGTDHSNYGIFPSMFPIYTSYVEGWGLYAEKLGFDMKLYGDPIDRYGHYTSDIFRTARLVVDTGIHALGWSRDEAIEYMFNLLDFSREEVEREIDRYITWPGQALGYKYGQLFITTLRDWSIAMLGEKLNIKDFHTVVLDAYGPIEFLEDAVDKWIDETIGETIDETNNLASTAQGSIMTISSHLTLVITLIWAWIF